MRPAEIGAQACPMLAGQRISYVSRSTGQPYTGSVVGPSLSGGLMISLDGHDTVKDVPPADLGRIAPLDSRLSLGPTVAPPFPPSTPLCPEMAGYCKPCDPIAGVASQRLYLPGQRVLYTSRSTGQQYSGSVIGPSTTGGVQLSLEGVDGIKEVAAADLGLISLVEDSVEPPAPEPEPELCERGCGRLRFRHHTTCCSKCRGVSGPHSVDCSAKCGMPKEQRVRPAVPPGFCIEGCERLAAPGYQTCCPSCSYLAGKLGFCGHTADCDVRCNNGMETPWYWRGSDASSRSVAEVARLGRHFHDEIQEEYVRNMGTKLVQQTLPSALVVKCLRVQDSSLWQKYATKRAEIRSRRPPELTSLKPLTHESLDYSAVKTLDHLANEVWLFHGTTDQAAKSIASTDFRLPKVGGGLFGKGLYFADKASKSWGYSSSCADGNVIMLCRVVLGNLYHHKGGIDQHAEKRIVGTEFDSLMGIASADNREFLVYDNAPVYPEYILYVKKGGDARAAAAKMGVPAPPVAKNKNCDCVIA